MVATIEWSVRSNAPSLARVSNHAVNNEGEPEGLAALLRYRRERAGRTVVDVASELEVHRSTYSTWEHGTKPRPEHRPALRAYLGLTEGEFFDRLESDSNAKDAAVARQVTAALAAVERVERRFEALEAKLEAIESRLGGGSRGK